MCPHLLVIDLLDHSYTMTCKNVSVVPVRPKCLEDEVLRFINRFLMTIMMS